jgi:hypothetical protein
MGGRCRQTMFTKQVSGGGRFWIPHSGRGGAAGRANSKKELLTLPSVSYRREGRLAFVRW